jgi:exodeoxyribonuclease V beta subunit
VHSYSSLLRDALERTSSIEIVDVGESTAVDAPAGEPPADSSPSPQLAELAGWRGRRFGNALHTAFETCDLRAPIAGQHVRVRRALRAHGLPQPEATLVTPLVRLLERVRVADLGLGDGWALADIATSDRRIEFQFDLALHDATISALPAVCAAHGYALDLPAAASAGTLEGFLKGYIDLVFRRDGRHHVLDYKSNWLGAHIDDYAPGALAIAMREHHYDLQLLIYCVALHRYLGTRVAGYDYDRHVGHALYLFVRGIGVAPLAGIHAERPSRALIEAIDALLGGSHGDAR